MKLHYILSSWEEIILLVSTVALMAILLGWALCMAIHNAKDARYWQDMATTNMVEKGHQ